MMRVSATPPFTAFRALNVQVASLERLQAAGHASSLTSQPVRGVDSVPGEATTRRVPAHFLDIRA